MDLPTAAALNGVFSGILLPIVIALVNQVAWDRSIRALVAFGLCLLCAAAATLLLTDARQPLNWVAMVATTLVSAGTMYRSVYEPLGIAPAIEAKTSVVKPKKPGR